MDGTRLRASAGLLAMAIFSGCTIGGPRTVKPDARLADSVMSQVEPGYVLLTRGATGSLDIDAASRATPVKDDLTRDFLDNSTFTGAYAKVWTKDSDFITATVFAFTKATDATRFAAFEVDFLRAAHTVNVAADPGIPNAQVYVLSGSTRMGARDVFCEGDIFPVERHAFIVTTCGRFPNSSDVAAQLAKTQYLAALTQQLGPSPTSPSLPSP